MAFSGFAFSLVGVLKYVQLVACDDERGSHASDSGPAVPARLGSRQRLRRLGNVDGRALGA
jgi:hypothetical protein